MLLWAAVHGLLAWSLAWSPAVEVAVAAEAPNSGADERAGLELFEKKIRPALVAHCYECHSVGAKIVRGNLYLDSRDGMRRGGDSGPAVVPGEADESLVLSALRYDGFEMPPRGKLADATIADFKRWIELGAPDPRDGAAPKVKKIDLVAGRQFWAFQPPRRSPPPPVGDAAWPRTDVDRFVLARLENLTLRPAPDAPREPLLRRLAFDLTGLPPSPDELEAFAADQSPDAVERQLDRLLASPRFGERWGRHWLDVARYAESSGKERNVPYRMAWRYRDYVIDAFNADMPYDQFVREQLAGDLLPAASTADRDRQLIATGFLAIGPQALTERVAEQFLLDVADEQLDAVCRVFLASTAGCARCHDHKFDPIPTTDYYALLGIFRSTENIGGVRPLRREFSYSHVAPLGDAAQRDGPCREVQQKLERLQKQLDQCRNDQRVANKNKDVAAQESLKRHEAETNRQIVAALAEAESPDPEASVRFAMAVRDRQPAADYAVRIRGELEDVGPIVPRGFLSVLSPEPPQPPLGSDRSGRLELASWIASRDNPLAARVLANRLWQHLFGVGLVESSDNFGLTGDKPSHPELLDHLALLLVDDQWSMKRAIRRMTLSRVYQQSGRHDAAAHAVDPGNRQLWRFGRRRLEAEAIRDAMLAVSGQLDLRRPGGSATLKLTNIELTSTAKILAADDSPRHRAVYLPMLRGNVPEMLGLFDMADPSLVIGRREVTSVATQALYLMNSRMVAELAKKFSERLSREAPDADGRVDLAYRLTLARSPDDAERRAMLEFVRRSRADQGESSKAEQQAWADACQTLLAAGEFLYVR